MRLRWRLQSGSSPKRRVTGHLANRSLSAKRSTRRQGCACLGNRRGLGCCQPAEQHVRNGMAAEIRAAAGVSGARPRCVVRPCGRTRKDTERPGGFPHTINRDFGRASFFIRLSGQLTHRSLKHLPRPRTAAASAQAKEAQNISDVTGLLRSRCRGALRLRCCSGSWSGAGY